MNRKTACKTQHNANELSIQCIYNNAKYIQSVLLCTQLTIESNAQSLNPAINGSSPHNEIEELNSGNSGPMDLVWTDRPLEGMMFIS